MVVRYQANDGTLFETAEKAFNYERTNDFPDIRVYDESQMLTDEVRTDHYNLIFKVHNTDERNCVLNFLRADYGDYEFFERYCAVEEPRTEDYPLYVVSENASIFDLLDNELDDYFNGRLSSDSDLALDREG